MWLSLNDSFVSIVQAKGNASILWVRARNKQHLINFLKPSFGEEMAKTLVKHTPDADYAYRTPMARISVEKLLRLHIEKLNYTNFKDSVLEPPLHSMYTKWWSDAVEYQQQGEHEHVQNSHIRGKQKVRRRA
jgi:hypothetical protein